ncbi:type II toxin-antitoxin system PemK/MazF family toxin [Lentibacillus salinarum]|uniref:mRNA interferase n=1 Tax=Lentibacillus salinarum TaxID=446820 RepID=A0ABW3ZXJ1_9BACI
MSSVPERGDLVYINLDPQAGHEQSGKRPCIVLSPEKFNRLTKFTVICPITSKQKGYPFEVQLPDNLAVHGVILTDQVKSVDKTARNLKIVGKAPKETVQECLDYIATFLS